MTSPSEYTRKAIEAHENARESNVCKGFGHHYAEHECTVCGEAEPDGGMDAIGAVFLLSLGMLAGICLLLLTLRVMGVL